MKQIFFIRHAKSSWENPELEDSMRPLNERGIKNAIQMGKFLNSKKLFPEMVILSPALRCLQTNSLLLSEIDKKAEIKFDERLYFHGADAIWKVAQSIPTKFNSIWIVSHNPDLSEALRQIDKTIPDISTCAVVPVACNTTSWTEISRSPRKILDKYLVKKLP